ncbi:hypothetical protein IAT40_006737 [Kwoniella sp. CBS 6097]
MAFFGGGMGGWRGSSWSPWSRWANGNDDGEDTSGSDSTTPQAIATTSAAPSPTLTPTPTQAPIATTSKPTTAPAPTPTPVQPTVPRPSSAEPPAAASPPSSSSSSPSPPESSKQTAATSSQAAQAVSTSQVAPSQGASDGSASSTDPAGFSASASGSASSSAAFSSSSSASGLPVGWEYYGCVPDSNGVPALNTTYATSDELTPSLCVNACAASQYHFAGLVNGNSCFCGSIAVTYSTTSSSSCSIPCSGESSIACGGKKSMSFYRLSPYDPTETFYANPTLVGQGGDLADVTKYLDAGSRTEIATMPTFTGSLIGAGSPNFRDSLHGVVFGRLIRADSGASRLHPGEGGYLEYWCMGTAALIVWSVGMIR